MVGGCSNKKIKGVIGIILLIVAIIAIIVALGTVNVRDLLVKFPFFVMLHINLSFASKIIGQYSALIICVLILLGFIAVKIGYNISVTSVSIGAFGIQIKNPDKLVKNNIRNYLNTKRSLFEIDLDNDNLVEVLDSYHEIYKWLRGQFELYDSDTKSEVYKDLNAMLALLNCFLTRYQSNYRLWYEHILDEEYADKDIAELQKDYRHYEEMSVDIKKLNEAMLKYAKEYKIESGKWIVKECQDE